MAKKRPLDFKAALRSHPAKHRRGAATVEFALVAPLLFLLFFGALEFCRVAMIRHTADNAVYEGCRIGIIPGATSDEVRNQTRNVMSTMGVGTINIEVTPAVIRRDTDVVTVRIDVPLDENSYVPNQFFNGQTIIRELTLRREGVR